MPEMPERVDWYEAHPLTTKDRRMASSPSAWVRGFSCEDVRPLIVCRGPIRKEAMDVFEQMGITHYGMLLSEKDSIVFTQALAPELRRMRPEHVHRVRDYTGATGEERVQRMHEIAAIARDHGYTHVFAGYGFMAEDEQFVRVLEEAGLRFIGPRSSVQRAAGRKDEAKRTALSENVSITPGIDDVTSRVLLRKQPDQAALRALCVQQGLEVEPALVKDGADIARAAAAVLEASYRRGLDLYSIDELSDEIERCAAQLFTEQPGHRVRLKAIGGGGGKGQRILTGIPRGGSAEDAAVAASKARAMVLEILAEVKAAGVGDNKNILLELNIEETRHNEIQLLGNGTWCIALGGRDCSLQMHEQKLLEVSVTEERLAEAAARARRSGRTVEATALEYDLETLRRMEAEGERFGVAVGLNSASTFECIVSGEHHFFMEMNTRIQVEHRVSELCYSLRFRNPSDASEFFDVTSLVEAMALVERHGERLPRPFRIPREGAAVEARLNATDSSLSPHAFGVIISWTDSIEHEIRDDQGICTKNPDTGLFVHYRLAGAYDSNIALLVTYGDHRQESYERLCEILRRAKLRGHDLHTNLEFHYGLVHWFLARGVWAKPTTRFVVPYLTQVGLLHEATLEMDLVFAWTHIGAKREKRLRAHGEGERVQMGLAATRRALQLKETLLKRPLDALFNEAHIFSAWLSRNLANFAIEDQRVVWKKNPLEVLADTYWLLNMDHRTDVPAAHVIWDHDNELLQTGLAFYRRLEARLAGADHRVPWTELEATLARETPPEAFDPAAWERVRASHEGFQCGLELLDLLPLIGDRTRFFELRVEDDLGITIPERLTDQALQARMKKVLAPPPATRANEIVAFSGGMFYAQEAPHLPPFVTVGSHFNAGDPLYIIEVMKMFNKVHAPFAGTIDKVLMGGGEGTIVRKGQPLFAVTPDERIVEESPADRQKRQREATTSYLGSLLGHKPV
jgi:acetyl/propionyl-CoA carboxylase alpha subunit